MATTTTTTTTTVPHLVHWVPMKKVRCSHVLQEHGGAKELLKRMRVVFNGLDDGILRAMGFDEHQVVPPESSVYSCHSLRSQNHWASLRVLLLPRQRKMHHFCSWQKTTK
jgi:hypothetical protein